MHQKESKYHMTVRNFTSLFSLSSYFHSISCAKCVSSTCKSSRLSFYTSVQPKTFHFPFIFPSRLMATLCIQVLKAVFEKSFFYLPHSSYSPSSPCYSASSIKYNPSEALQYPGVYQNP